MQRRIERGFLIVGAELGNVERFIIVGGEDRSPFLNRFAEGIGDFVGHVGVDDHDLAKVSGRKRHRRFYRAKHAKLAKKEFFLVPSNLGALCAFARDMVFSSSIENFKYLWLGLVHSPNQRKFSSGKDSDLEVRRLGVGGSDETTKLGCCLLNL